MTRRIIIAGMPNSGKSTFIAALTHILVANEKDCALKLTGPSTEEGHLVKLEKDWLSGKKIQRTNSSTETWVEMHILEKAGDRKMILSLPDKKGESFEQPATIGYFDAELFEELVDADGLIVFVNADRVDDKMMISDLGDLVSDEAAPKVETPAKRFDPREMPEEAKIVELLQFANRRPLSSRLRKLVIIISAWDVVEAELQDNPEAWLSMHTAMLSQFCAYNSDLWDTRVYGVSAQGGALPAERDRLMAFDKPTDRVKIVGHGAAQHDLTLPLQWLIA